LREIILKRNNLGETFLESLQTSLKYDRFLKVIDLSQNLIPETPLKTLIKQALKENASIINFNVNKNPGLTDKLKK
jgi:Ran GTPase-activating protein (RanGAP) involved in mRNA processing and transport